VDFSTQIRRLEGDKSPLVEFFPQGRASVAAEN
jgi:hypothetical protein